MKISYNWLKTYLDFPYSAEELSAILTQTGLEVESLESFNEIQGGLKGVVIGEVLTCEKHPDADKLKVTTVSVGTDTPLQIVCGAPNVAAGQKVVVATVGCTLFPKPDEAFEIKKAKIRGVASEGMLCAEDELGLGSSHDGILVLPESAVVGMAAAEFFELEEDIQLEIGLTPNRADAMGHIGVARDIKAYHNLQQANRIELNMPALQVPDNTHLPQLDIQINDTDACKRYLAIKLDGVQVAPSPKWLQNRLKAVGLKPINNVVDISNYIQRELGTPLHIFDAHQIGAKLQVRCAQTNEAFLGLDNNNYKLAGHELVIANPTNALCLAGVLGGLESGVSANTTEILIEAALFDAVRIRKAARQHGLNTDASFRFERGVDPDLTETALLRCVQLLQEIAGAKVNSATFTFEGSVPKPIRLQLSAQQLHQMIGVAIPTEQVEQILKDLDFEIHTYQNNSWDLTVPAYRVDVTRPIDVIEEILRIYGLNTVEIPQKWNLSLSPNKDQCTDYNKEACAEFLVGRGFFEVMNNSLTKKHYSTYLDASFGAAIGLLNPLSQDLGIMRQSLVFGLLENLAYNQNRQQTDLQFFEFGQDYQLHNEVRQETQRLALALMGKQSPVNWNNTAAVDHDIYSLKKEVYAVLERLGLSSNLKEYSAQHLLFEQGVGIERAGKTLVEFGQISVLLQQEFDLKQNVYYAQFDWTALASQGQQERIRYQEVPKTFAVRRDLSLLLDMNTTYQELLQSARGAETKLLQNIELFDVYEGKNLPEGKKSYALAFYLQDKQQTLSETQIEKAMQRIIKALETDCAAQLRN
ncbi:MAG: phenylalanine--tRNA ligase subunit beta [Flavobacteriia bacterium]|nr:phenylalanine--tRNA ligase subunit beta [Flavobacteriia bacterium]